MKSMTYIAQNGRVAANLDSSAPRYSSIRCRTLSKNLRLAEIRQISSSQTDAQWYC